jgi:hypothetical protein
LIISDPVCQNRWFGEKNRDPATPLEKLFYQWRKTVINLLIYHQEDSAQIARNFLEEYTDDVIFATGNKTPASRRNGTARSNASCVAQARTDQACAKKARRP